MPNATGLLAITLTVSNASESALWYQNVFHLEVKSEYESNESHLILLQCAASSLELCLQDHNFEPAERFSEFRAGLDHIEFLVANRSDLDEWAIHLDVLRINHSGVKEPTYSGNAMITFRDPDNI